MGYQQKRFVPGHFVGHGQFKQWERPHWATLGGAWAPGAPPPNNAGFSQMPNPQGQPPQPQHPMLGPGGNMMGPGQMGGIMRGIANPQPPGLIPRGTATPQPMQPMLGPGGLHPMPGMPLPQQATPNLVDMRKQLAVMNLVQMMARLGKHAQANSGAGDGMRA